MWQSVSISEAIVGEARLSSKMSGDIHYLGDDKFELVQEGKDPIPLITLLTDDERVVTEVGTVSKCSILSMLMKKDGRVIRLPFSGYTVKRVIDLLLNDYVDVSEVDEATMSFFFPGSWPLHYLHSSLTRDDLCEARGWTSVLLMASVWYQKKGTHNYHLYDIAGVSHLMRFILDEGVDLGRLVKMRMDNIDEEELYFLNVHSADLGIASVSDSLVSSLIRTMNSTRVTEKDKVRVYRWLSEKWKGKSLLHDYTRLVAASSSLWKDAEDNALLSLNISKRVGLLEPIIWSCTASAHVCE